MAKLNRKLNIYKTSNNTTQSCELYSTVAETGGNYIPLTVDGVDCYARLGSSSDGSASSLAVHKNSNGSDYRVAQRGMFTVSISQSSHQEIVVRCNGSSYTSSFTCPYGSTYSVSLTPSTNYSAGSLNTTSGTVTSDISIYATAATYSPPATYDRCCR